METKYSTISTVNGAFTIDAEHGTDLKAALVFFHDRCKTLWNYTDDPENPVQRAVVQVIDSNMNVIKEERIYPIVMPVNDVPEGE